MKRFALSPDDSCAKIAGDDQFGIERAVQIIVTCRKDRAEFSFVRIAFDQPLAEAFAQRLML